MILYSEEMVKEGIDNKEESIAMKIDLLATTKLQLLLTGKAVKGVELFGVGAMEIRTFHMIEYMKIINHAIANGYRVHVRKEGTYFSKGNWILEFIKE